MSMTMSLPAPVSNKTSSLYNWVVAGALACATFSVFSEMTAPPTCPASHRPVTPAMIQAYILSK